VTINYFHEYACETEGLTLSSSKQGYTLRPRLTTAYEVNCHQWSKFTLSKLPSGMATCDSQDDWSTWRLSILSCYRSPSSAGGSF